MISDININKIAGWFLVAVASGLLAGWAYAVKTSWQNETRLSEISNDLKSIKRSLISISIKTDPNNPTVVTDLLSGTPVKKGIDRFNAGDFPAAYNTWSIAAINGDRDSAFAISIANSELKQRLKDPNLTTPERGAAVAALRFSPKIVERNGEFDIKSNK